MSVPTLVTIAGSHYCDVARWALDRFGIPYSESSGPPLFHNVYAMRHTLQIRRHTMPLLYYPDGTHFGESHLILKHAQERALASNSNQLPLLLPPVSTPENQKVEEWQRLFSKKLGVHSRRFIYYYLLQDKELAVSTLCHGNSFIVRQSFRLMFGTISDIMRKGMSITEKGLKSSIAQLDDLFTKVSQTLTDGLPEGTPPRPFIVGGSFTAADLTFAALAAPVLMPYQYPVPLPSLLELHARWPDMVEHIQRWKNSPAGQHALKMYEVERDRVVVAGGSGGPKGLRGERKRVQMEEEKKRAACGPCGAGAPTNAVGVLLSSKL